jgi:hypothetical protein
MPSALGTAVWRFLLVLLLIFPDAAAQSPHDADPVKLITAIYQTYTVDNSPAVPNVYSRRLQLLLDTDAKNTPPGDAGTIDWDVFVDGNNWELSNLRIALVARSGSDATVQVSFDNFGKPRKQLFALIREQGKWRIDDIASMREGARWTMSKILTHAPDAFPDAKEKR